MIEALDANQEDPVPFRLHGEIFEVHRDQVEAGNFENQRKLLKAKISSCAFNLCVSGVLLLWFFAYLPKTSTRPIYLAEKIWFASWIGSQAICFFFIMVAAGFAYMRP